MPRLFAVVRSRGPGWDTSAPLEGQKDWEAHAAFMDGLANEGFVVVGGPLEGSAEALFAVRADSPEEIVARLAADPWTANGLLRVSRISPWTLRLGSLP